MVDIVEKVFLSFLTTFKIGGEAQFLALPSSLSEWQLLLQTTQLPVTVLGKGSNVLIRDRGIEGLLIYLGKMDNRLSWVDDRVVKVSAGVRLNYLVNQGIKRGLDTVFLSGIPGTIGGALAMNAGALGDAFWNHVLEVEVLTNHGELLVLPAEKFQASYREVKGLPFNNWFASATLSFEKGEIKRLAEAKEAWLLKRHKNQPVHLPNAGSIFRNPPGDYAARLIEQAGLKGYRLGNAEVSTCHANFIVNLGGAKAIEVEKLMTIIIEKVVDKFGITLVPEIKILGL